MIRRKAHKLLALSLFVLALVPDFYILTRPDDITTPQLLRLWALTLFVLWSAFAVFAGYLRAYHDRA